MLSPTEFSRLFSRLFLLLLYFIEQELKELKESVSQSYHDQLKELQHFLEVKQKEVEEVNRVLAEQKQGMENLSERLNASNQSCSEANEIIIR